MDKAGNTIEFLFRAKRDKAAARRFFDKAITQNGAPETVNMTKAVPIRRRFMRECRARDVHQDSVGQEYLNNLME